MKFAGPLLVLIAALVDNQKLLQVPILIVVAYWLCGYLWDILQRNGVRPEAWSPANAPDRADISW